MKSIWPVAAMILMFSLVFTLAPSAQQATSQRRADGMPGNLFNPKSVETVRGEVVSIEAIAAARGMPPGVKLVLRAEGGMAIPVFLGPQWYLENEDFELEPSDWISVKGFRTVFQAEPALVAAVVFKKDRVLRLRDDHGVPVWSPWIVQWETGSAN
jgi:hypothetical protein